MFAASCLLRCQGFKQNRSVAKTVGKASSSSPLHWPDDNSFPWQNHANQSENSSQDSGSIQDISGIFQEEWNTDLLSLFCCILSLPSRSLNTRLLPRTCNCHVVHMVHLHQKHPAHPRSICLLSWVATGQWGIFKECVSPCKSRTNQSTSSSTITLWA